MAKAKNPKRVKAGKKAWAKMKRAGVGIAGANKKKKSGGRSATKRTGGGSVTGSKRPKRLSASALVLAGGLITLFTAMGRRKANVFVAQLQVFTQRLGLNTVVTGATVVTVIVGAKLASSVSPWFGRKWRGFLSGFGLRP